jgi:hypothetical protein
MSEIFSKKLIIDNGIDRDNQDVANNGREMVDEPFKADQKDMYFALIAFVLGFLFVRWVMMHWNGWGVTVFTLLYCSVVIIYLLKKAINITKEGGFWFSVTLVISLSYSIFENPGLEPWRNLVLFFSAVYAVICSTGHLIQGKTSNWIIMDNINSFFVIPFRNFFCQYKSLAGLAEKKKIAGKKFFSVILGILLALLVIAIVAPMLLKADSGGFSKITDVIIGWFKWEKTNFYKELFNLVLAVPVAAYMFGLIAASAHSRKTNTFKRESIQNTIDSLRILQPVTVIIFLGLVACLYIIFIASQLPYFFSAFKGQIPEGWQVYSEYARSGFFELCEIAIINLSLLIFANILSKKQGLASASLKFFNCLFSVLTILLIATAFSKMLLYIDVYGLSVRRILPCIFMIFMLLVFIAVIALQKLNFSIVRVSVYLAAVMFCIICFLNLDGFTSDYNANRYLEGTLNNFDVEILYRAKSAGVPAALEVYNRTENKELKSEIETYLQYHQGVANLSQGKSHDNIQSAKARKMLNESY